jgi:hypothetical protein
MFKMALERSMMIDLLTELLGCTLAELEVLQHTTIPMDEIVAQAESKITQIDPRRRLTIEDLVEAMFEVALDKTQQLVENLHNHYIYSLNQANNRKMRGLDYDEVNFAYLRKYYAAVGEDTPNLKKDTDLYKAPPEFEVYFVDNAEMYAEFFKGVLPTFFELTGSDIQG